MGWLNKLFNLETYKTNTAKVTPLSYRSDPMQQASGTSASKRLKLVLMHDRTQLSPEMMEQMRDELVDVISRYVEIDKTALDINFESESNTIALVANIPVLRARSPEDSPFKKADPIKALAAKEEEKSQEKNQEKNKDEQDQGKSDTSDSDEKDDSKNPFEELKKDDLGEVLQETVKAAEKPPVKPATGTNA